MTHSLLPTTVTSAGSARTRPAGPTQAEAAGRSIVSPPTNEVPVFAYIGDQFHTLVLQPATLCNLNCAYCYLPERKINKMMSIEVAQACARSIVDQNASRPVDVVWHGGEPTVTPVAHMRSLLTSFRELGSMVRHGIQTNGTLIDSSWCELFGEFGFEVGVSVDGPAAANRHRVDWCGNPTWERTMRGIRILQEHGIEFTVVCVVSPETIDHPDALVDFFNELGCSSVGFNLEEQEGTGRPPLDDATAYRFWRQLWQRRAADDPLPIRDLDRI